ncbi:MAG: hypothetical protein KDB26_01995 [Microthrixaceae bacterium]|nr:hypothetical protein [Microthrixaceae bacterium]
MRETFVLYFIGDSPEDALEGLPFDEADGADMARLEQGYAHMYSVAVPIDSRQMELCESR